MPECSQCGQPLNAAETQCPACGQPVNSSPPETGPLTPPEVESLRLGDYFKTGWEIFKQYPLAFISFFLINILIHLILYEIPWLGSVVAFAISTPLLFGNFIVSAKLLQRQTPEFRDFFAGFYFFVPLFLLSVVTSVFILIGLILLIIPGIYLIVAYMFASYLVIDRGLDFWPAMELSRRTVQPRWFNFFVLMLLLTLLNLAGALLFGVGLLLTVPLTFCIMTVVFQDIFGLQSDYSRETPRLTGR
jgi:uncharacterized membrane protein